MRRITFVQARKTPTHDVNRELQWLGNALGLFNQRDKDSSCFRIFIILVRRARSGEALASDDIAQRLDLSRATVVHHLNKLIDAGIVLREHEGYLLRSSTLSRMVDQLRDDTQRILSDMQEVAREIDERLG